MDWQTNKESVPMYSLTCKAKITGQNQFLETQENLLTSSQSRMSQYWKLAALLKYCTWNLWICWYRGHHCSRLQSGASCRSGSAGSMPVSRFPSRLIRNSLLEPRLRRRPRESHEGKNRCFVILGLESFNFFSPEFQAPVDRRHGCAVCWVNSSG